MCAKKNTTTRCSGLNGDYRYLGACFEHRLIKVNVCFRSQLCETTSYRGIDVVLLKKVTRQTCTMHSERGIEKEGSVGLGHGSEELVRGEPLVEF